MLKRILKSLSVATFLIPMSAYAVDAGFYLGLMAGSATNSGSTQEAQVDTTPPEPPATTPANPKSTQFGSRVYMGYKINRFAGVEAGLTYFSEINYDTKGVDTCSSANASVRDFDAVLRGSVPLGHFEAFGKAGVAVTYQTTSGALNPDLNNQCGLTTYEVAYKPTYSAGVSYDLSQNWVADVSWNRITIGGVFGNVDLYALGISYHFVDVYCGQFLC